MKALLLWALLGTFTGLHAPKNAIILEDFEKERFIGLWYEVGIISSSDVFMKPKFSKKFGVMLMGLRQEGIFTMMIYDKYGQCVLEQFLAIPMDIPGKYRIPCRNSSAKPNDINAFKEFWAERNYSEDQIYMLQNDEKCTKRHLYRPK